jgi:transcriptional regulator with XRE-family HTH domain
MNVQELTIIGKILCGNRWQAQFARLLGVSPVTVSRWVKGKQTISPALERAIYRLSDKPPFVRQKEKRLRAELNVFAHKRITLYHARADSVSLDCSIDTIICSPFDTKPLSDISQSIESVQYLRTVLHNLASKLSENGKIIVLLPWNTDPRVLNAVPYTSGYVGSQYISTILKCDSKIAYQFGGGECVFSGEAPLFKNSDERVELEEWLLKTCTRTCEVICDPFMGEGNVGERFCARWARVEGMNVYLAKCCWLVKIVDI